MASALAGVVLAGGVAAAPAAAGDLAPVPGSLRDGAEAVDPVDGGRWLVRAWQPRRYGPERAGLRGYRCLHTGRPAAGGLTRVVAGAARPLRWRDRTVCGDVRRFSESPPVLVERLVDDPAAGPARTVVAGMLRDGERAVRLDVAGVPHALPLRERTFLAVLPGSVRRADLTLVFGGRRPRPPLTFTADRFRALVPGSLGRALTVPALGGGPDLAVTTYRLDQGGGFPVLTCVDVGRAIGAEGGQFDRRWGAFLDAPTVTEYTAFEDGRPRLVDPAARAGCGDDEAPEAFVMPRTSRRSVALVVLAGPRLADLTLRGPDGASVPLTAVPGPPALFLAQMPSTGVLGETARLTGIDASGRRRSAPIYLGPHDVARRFAAYTVRGRRVRVAFGAYAGHPPGRVTVQEGPRRVRIRVTARNRTTFTPAGFPRGRDDELATWCVDVRLRRPLGGRRVVDATSGRTARPRALRCTLRRPAR